MEDDHYNELMHALVSYADGNYNINLDPVGDSDIADSFRVAIKMLGEQLQETTVSLDFFLNIYNSVDSMVFVLDKTGKIFDANEKAIDVLGFRVTDEKTVFFKDVTNSSIDLIPILSHKIPEKSNFNIELFFKNVNHETVPVVCSCSAIKDTTKGLDGYLVIATNISERIENENRILRKVVETQDKEQTRIAKDLHDDLGQTLTMIKLMMTTIKTPKPQTNKMLNECVRLMDESIDKMRRISFNMMPSTLQTYGLIDALDQLFFIYENQLNIKFNFLYNAEKIAINKEHEIALYRIAQEFINNSIKHASPTEISIHIEKLEKTYKVTFSDNGKGFDYESKKSVGNGISNIRTRCKLYKWNVNYSSSIGVGTTLIVILPIYSKI